MAPKKAALREGMGAVAAKKTPARKGAAKKAAKKSARPRGHDLRRAFEHLQRVRVLHGYLEAGADARVSTLSRLAQQALGAEQEKSAADLLRAAEHVAFGSLSPAMGGDEPSSALVAAAQGEYDDLLARAQRHWADGEMERPRGVAGVYKAVLTEAKAALREGALHRALEFARGAEALSHVSLGAPQIAQERPPQQGRLRSEGARPMRPGR